MDCIKTFALIAAQNPLMQDTSESYNKRANRNLTGQLKSAHIPYVPVKGKFGGNAENSWFLINPPFEFVHKLATEFDQTSFIFGTSDETGIEAHYWELHNPDKPYASLKNPYDDKDVVARVENRGDAEGNFSQLSQQLKFAFPFSIFDSICRKISDNVSTSGFEVGSCDLGNAMTRLHKRSQVYKGVQELIDSSL